MFYKHINGVVCEYLAAAWFVNNGYTVSWPLNGFVEYDFIADNGTETKRVQVKKIYFDNSKRRYISSLVLTHKRADGSTKNKKYNENSFDLCAFVCIEHNAIYVVPIDFVYKRRCITFYPDGTKPFKRPFDFEQFKKTLINLYDE